MTKMFKSLLLPGRPFLCKPRRRLGRLVVCAAWIALSLGGSSCQRAPAPAPRRVLRIIVFPGFARVATAVAQALETMLPGIDVEMRQRVQPVEDVKALQRGDADVAFA